MPYIITTRYPHRSEEEGGSAPDERRAVATLDDAQEYVDQIDYHYEVPEQGGTVGPLPDGTVIEVERVSLTTLARRSFDGHPPSTDPARILEAFNAPQDPGHYVDCGQTDDA